ncbi:acetate--CoA ligase family protein [Bradyrhizobium sp. LMTR 3]|uniref:acetate--CoA ligase family protein n=1 Tax=Bradyrhizobium sp. LMTR 3 TaxID=189873 RepID=UPI000810B77E|nr:acetate--CoA ligase family protein [Bradyrhizobium sp. LMTR 3]OCK60407.1 6-carboxyhexanoate--CoA ligase [Bradyrhizobium sp. LMTR 3]
MDALERLIRPKSVAIIGASADAGKLTGRPLAFLQKYGYGHEVFPVNPRYQSIGGYPCFPDIRSLPHAPDVAIVLVGSARVPDAVRELGAIGTGAAIVLAGGFGESGADGMARQQELKSAAGTMRLLGPNTIGLVNVTDGIALSASAALQINQPAPGSIALVSQSGGILGALLSRAEAQGVGFSKLVATGNESDIDVSDLVDYLVDDPATQVIALYLEGLRKPAQFRQAALRAARAGKPIVAFKVGRSESGAQSASSHTGALAGSDVVYDALFRQLGIIRALQFSDLLDIPLALSSARRLQGRRVAVVTSTGGSASLVADAAGLAGFETPAPDPMTAERLKALNIPDAVLDRNPIDVTLAGVKSEYFRNVLDSVLESPSYDAVAVILGSSSITEPEIVGAPLRDCFARTDKPVVVFASPHAPHAVRHLNLSGIPTFAAPEACVTAFSAMWHIRRKISPQTGEPAIPVAVGADVRRMLRPGPLNEYESKALFAKFGVPITREVCVATPEEAAPAALNFGGNVVIKVLSRDVLHKSDLGGVAVNVSPRDSAATCRRMAEAFSTATNRRPEGFLVQELVTGAVELILGFKDDKQLGPSILLGMGGIAAELYKDTAVRLAPLSRQDAEEMIGELKSAPLLRGFRGRPVADVDALVDAMLAFSNMVTSIGKNLLEAEINPLFVLPSGNGVKAADGVVVVADAEAGS